MTAALTILALYLVGAATAFIWCGRSTFTGERFYTAAFWPVVALVCAVLWLRVLQSIFAQLRLQRRYFKKSWNYITNRSPVCGRIYKIFCLGR